MPSDYPGTAVPFENYALADLHDPIVHGAGFTGLEDTADVYRAISETFDKAVTDLRAVMTASQSAHEGEAADAGRQHIARVVKVGEAGAEQARLAMYALQEQAGYFSTARMYMNAAAEAAAEESAASIPNPLTTLPGDGKARTIAIDAAQRYQDNSNHNLANIFQPFDHPDVPAPDVSIAGTAHTTGGVGAHGAAPVGTAGSVAAPVGVAPSGPGVVPLAPGSSGTNTSPEPGAIPVSPGANRGSDSRPAPATPSTARPGAVSPSTPGAASVPDKAAGPSTVPGAPRSVTPDAGRSGSSSPTVGGSGWAPGEPWTSRIGSTPNASGGGVGGRVSGRTATDGLGRSPGGGGSIESRPVTGRPQPSVIGEPATPQRGASTGQQTPFMPMGGAGGRGQDMAHPRPPWLVEEDPDAVWLSGLPPHGPAVIEPLEE